MDQETLVQSVARLEERLKAAEAQVAELRGIGEKVGTNAAWTKALIGIGLPLLLAASGLSVWSNRQSSLAQSTVQTAQDRMAVLAREYEVRIAKPLSDATDELRKVAQTEIERARTSTKDAADHALQAVASEASKRVSEAEARGLLRLRHLTIEDEAGQPRIQMTCKDGAPVIAIRASDGKSRIVLGQNAPAGGVLLSVSGGDDEPAIAMSADRERAGLTLASPETKGRLGLLVDKKGGYPRLNLIDDQGKTRLELGLVDEPQAWPRLLFRDANGHADIFLGCQNNHPRITAHSDDGGASVSLVSSPEASGLQVLDGSGAARIELFHGPVDMTWLYLRDKKGAVRAMAQHDGNGDQTLLQTFPARGSPR